ncbi:hypothetical protein Pelo_5761 [Pelomyxa schiedti]|nr:hypothetical protein Pelo_5761 [Pelomyxa schiedti]
MQRFASFTVTRTAPTSADGDPPPTTSPVPSASTSTSTSTSSPPSVSLPMPCSRGAAIVGNTESQPPWPVPVRRGGSGVSEHDSTPTSISTSASASASGNLLEPGDGGVTMFDAPTSRAVARMEMGSLFQQCAIKEQPSLSKALRDAGFCDAEGIAARAVACAGKLPRRPLGLEVEECAAVLLLCDPEVLNLQTEYFPLKLCEILSKCDAEDLTMWSGIFTLIFCGIRKLPRVQVQEDEAFHGATPRRVKVWSGLGKRMAVSFHTRATVKTVTSERKVRVVGGVDVGECNSTEGYGCGVGDIVGWCGFEVASNSLSAAKLQLLTSPGNECTGTVFILRNSWGYDISWVPGFEDGKEVLLEPDLDYEITGVLDGPLVILTLSLKQSPLLFESVITPILAKKLFHQVTTSPEPYNFISQVGAFMQEDCVTSDQPLCLKGLHALICCMEAGLKSDILSPELDLELILPHICGMKNLFHFQALLENHISSCEIQEMGMSTLCSITKLMKYKCSNFPSSVKYRFGGFLSIGFEPVIKIMITHLTHPGIQEQACNAFFEFFSDYPGPMDRKDFLPQILNAIERHPGVRKLQISAWKALSLDVGCGIPIPTDAIGSLIQAMRFNQDHCDVQMCCLSVLKESFLWSQDSTTLAQLWRDSIPIIINSMRVNMTSAQFQIEALDSLSHMAETSNVQQQIVDMEGVTVIMQSLVQHHDDSLVTSSACATLEKVSASGFADTQLSNEHDLRLLLSYVAENCESACQVLVNVTEMNSGNQVLLVLYGAVPQLVIQSEQNPTRFAMGSLCFSLRRVLCNLFKNQENQVHVNTEVIHAISDLLESDTTSHRINSCQALSAISAFHRDNQLTILKCGTLKRLIAAIQSENRRVTNDNVAEYQNFIQQALLSLSNITSNNKDLQTAVVQDGVLPVLLESMEITALDLKSQQQGCETLLSIATGDSSAQCSIYCKGAVPIIIKAMKSFLSNQKLVNIACNLLTELTSTQPGGRVIVREEGGVPVITQVMKFHSSDIAVLTSCCKTLRNITTTNFDYDTTLVDNKEIVSCLCDALERHRMNTDIQICASNALFNVIKGKICSPPHRTEVITSPTKPLSHSFNQECDGDDDFPEEVSEATTVQPISTSPTTIPLPEKVEQEQILLSQEPEKDISEVPRSEQKRDTRLISDFDTPPPAVVAGVDTLASLGDVEPMFITDDMSLGNHSHSIPTLMSACEIAGVDNLEVVLEQCKEIAMLTRVWRPTFLTDDESGAISLYTFDYGDGGSRNPYQLVNRALFERNVSLLRKWRGVITLLLCGMRKLTRVSNVSLHRGITRRVSLSDYRVGNTIKWSAFSSTTTNLSVTKQFLTDKSTGACSGTLFILTNAWGYDVTFFSFIAEEKEILLEPDMSFEVMGVLDGPLIVITLSMKQTLPFLNNLIAPHVSSCIFDSTLASKFPYQKISQVVSYLQNPCVCSKTELLLSGLQALDKCLVAGLSTHPLPVSTVPLSIFPQAIGATTTTFVLRIVSDHADNPTIQEAGISVLGHLAILLKHKCSLFTGFFSDAVWWLVHSELITSACTLIHGVMDFHSTTPFLQATACKALAALLDFSNDYMNQDLQKSAWHSIKTYTAAPECTFPEFPDLSDPSRKSWVAPEMQQLVDTSYLMNYSPSTMWYKRKSDTKEVAEKILPALASAMKSHPRSSEVQESACLALAFSQGCQSDFIVPIVEVLNSFPDHTGAQQNGLLALNRVLLSFQEEALEPVSLWKSATMAAVQVMKRHASNPTLVLQSGMAIEKMSKSQELALTAVQHGIMGILTHSLLISENNEDFQCGIFGVLARVGPHAPDNHTWNLQAMDMAIKQVSKFSLPASELVEIISREPSVQKHLAQQTSVPILLTAMISNNHLFLASLSRVICNIFSNKENQPHASKKVLRVIRHLACDYEWFQSPRDVIYVCSAISGLCHSNRGNQLLFVRNGLQNIISALKKIQTSEECSSYNLLVGSTCTAVESICADNEVAQAAFVQAGGIPVILQAMSSTLTDVIAQKSIYHALNALAWNNPELQALLCQKGLIPLLLQSMEAHLQEPSLQNQGCVVIETLTSLLEVNRVVFVEEGAIKVLVDLMKLYPSRCDLQLQFTKSLYNLTATNTDLIKDYSNLITTTLAAMSTLHSAHSSCIDLKSYATKIQENCNYISAILGVESLHRQTCNSELLTQKLSEANSLMEQLYTLVQGLPNRRAIESMMTADIQRIITGLHSLSQQCPETQSFCTKLETTLSHFATPVPQSPLPPLRPSPVARVSDEIVTSAASLESHLSKSEVMNAIGQTLLKQVRLLASAIEAKNKSLISTCCTQISVSVKLITETARKQLAGKPRHIQEQINTSCEAAHNFSIQLRILCDTHDSSSLCTCTTKMMLAIVHIVQNCADSHTKKPTASPTVPQKH